MSLVTDEIDLRRWAAELEAAATIARQIAGTAFLPESHHRFFRDDRGRLLDGKDGRAYRLDVDATTATAAAAIMTGAELGLKPSAALRSITVINNTPALSALALRAILQHAGHDIWVDPASNSTKAVVRAKREGDGEVMASTWTIDRAKTAGLYPGAERSQWRRNPAAMLVARASAEAARWVAADAILGIPYTVEELIDEIEQPAPVAAIEPGVTVPTPRGEAAVAALPGPPADGDGTKRRRRKTAAPPPPLPTGPPASAAEPVEAEVVDDDGADPLGLDGGTEVVDEQTGEAHVEPPSNEGAKREPPEVAAANARPVPPEPEPGRAEKITKPMLDKLHAELRALGVGDDREVALGLVSQWAGREIASSRDLTFDEARTVLDRLDRLRKIAETLAEIDITESDALALLDAWTGRKITAVTDLTDQEAIAVAERLAALGTIAAKGAPDDGSH